MQEKTTIARPYAQAAFELARDQDSLDQWSGLLQRLGAVIADPLMRSLLNHPKLEEEALIGIIVDLCGDAVFDYGKNFIRILAAAGRLGVAREISELFETKRAEHIGLSEVEVISAYPLSDDQASRIQENMSKKLGSRVEISSHVDESLIGGVIIRAGDSVIDASLRGRLHELSNEFAS